MTTEELIEMLNILLDNAKMGCADITVIEHVSFDSFKFVLAQTIQALSQEPTKDAISQNQSNACSILDDECPYPYKHCWGCSLNYQYELAKLELEKKDRLPQRKSNANKKHLENTLDMRCDDAISRLDKIRQIIAIPNSVIQEDVMKYKMICEVMDDDKSVS